jgi:hypothetical protein
MLEKRTIKSPIETLISDYNVSYEEFSDIINTGRYQIRSKEYIDINYLAHNIYKFYGLSTVNKRFYITRRMKRLKDYYLNLCENYKFVYDDVAKLKFDDIVDIDFPKYQRSFVEQKDVNPLDFINFHEEWKNNARSKEYETARLAFKQPDRNVKQLVEKEFYLPPGRNDLGGYRKINVEEDVEKPHEYFMNNPEYLEKFDVIVKNKKKAIPVDQKVFDKKAVYDNLKENTVNAVRDNLEGKVKLFEEGRVEDTVKEEINTKSAQLLYEEMFLKRTMNVYNIIEKYHSNINTDIVTQDSLAVITQRLENFKKVVSSKIRFGNLVKYVNNKINPSLMNVKMILANNYPGCKVHLHENGHLRFNGRIDLPYQDYLVELFHKNIYENIVGDINRMDPEKTIEQMVNEVEDTDSTKCYLVNKENLPHYLMKRAGSKRRYLKMLKRLGNNREVQETIYSVNILHIVDMPKEFHFKFLGLYEITNNNNLLRLYVRNNKCKKHFDL